MRRFLVLLLTAFVALSFLAVRADSVMTSGGSAAPGQTGSGGGGGGDHDDDDGDPCDDDDHDDDDGHYGSDSRTYGGGGGDHDDGDDDDGCDPCVDDDDDHDDDGHYGSDSRTYGGGGGHDDDDDHDDDDGDDDDCDPDYGHAPVLTISSATLRRGQQFQVELEECTANITVTFKLGTTVIGTATTDGDGEVTTNLTVPSSFPFGPTTLIAQCGPESASTQVEIVSNLTLNKSTLLRKEQFVATVHGCGSNKTVTFKIGSTTLGTATSPSNGGPTVKTLTVPAAQPYGPATVTATCNSVTHSAPVTIISNLTLDKTTLHRNEYFQATVVGCGNYKTVTFKIGSTSLGSTKSPLNGGPTVKTLKVPSSQAYGAATVTATCNGATHSASVMIVSGPAPTSSRRDASSMPGGALPLAVLAGGVALLGIYLSPRKGSGRRRSEQKPASS